MPLKLFGENRSNAGSAVSLNKRSLSSGTLQEKQFSISSLRSSANGTAELIRPSASKDEAIRIRRSGFQNSGRVGRREDDPVYYRFTLSRRGQIDISIQNQEAGGFFQFLTPSLQIRLERANGKNVRTQTIEGGEFEHLTRTLRRGTYYISVTSGGESVPFRLGLRTRNGAELFS